jgi:hypothetical protein
LKAPEAFVAAKQVPAMNAGNFWKIEEEEMKKIALVLGLVLLAGTAAYGTPSTQIWIPSTDIQPFGKAHLGFDQYIKTRRIDGATREANVINNGITLGILPFEKIQMELGMDYRSYGAEPADSSPFYFNAKVGTPEGSLFTGSPALAAGVYDLGTNKYDSVSNFGTDFNIVYALAAKTLGKAGRLSAGYYKGNDELLLDKNGQKDEKGVLLSWDRTISEISEKLWVAVDYMGGDNSYGALSYGVAWKFSPNVGVIFGMDKYNNDTYKPTYTFQVDIDI